MRDYGSCNWYWAILMVLFTTLIFTSCTMVTKDDLLYLNDQIVSLNARVNKLQDRLNEKLSEDLNAKIEPIRVNQAEMGAELDKVKEQIQTLSGKVEENALLIKRQVERDTTGQDMMKAQLADLTNKVAQLESKLKMVENTLRLAVGPPGKAQAMGREGQAAVEVPTSGPGAAGEVGVSEEQRLYDESLASFKQGKYEEAISSFKIFLKKYPTSDLADNAQFWIGESYMALKQYEKAILAFQDVIKKYPDGNKVPGAMLKQALAFYEIKDKVSSKLLLKKIIRKYPDSNEAKIAQAKLKAFR
ncbi:MAG: tol-pal system protein YbgF [Deltaproteobacteria bacterium]|nr:tol-pal system protein YbgF [Deltaproteobacteria bacterium]MBW1927731.1 tol-pal system protein YbgF [Deltaproteobacteria bacterium]